MTNPQVKLYNTLTRQVEEFKPIEAGKAKVYCCGPTVYDFQHIGNFKTFIVENLLVNTLKLAGYDVNFVMNITDVGHLVSDADAGEDKMMIASKRENKKSHEIAKYYTDIFFDDWDKLKLVRPNTVCAATEHIKAMIDLIKIIEEKGFAYFSNGNVYFDVSKFKEYGKLALLDVSKLKLGESAAIDPNKRNPLDFVLWFTKSKFENHELLWESPWGMGYPGWHIECSAMAMKYLGEKIDIHCGGVDHIPVHHTNEIAQAESATGSKWVNYWMHSEFMLINQEKMSKCTGKFIVLKDLINDGYDPIDYKMLVYGTSYRKQMNFSKESMDNAKRNVEKLKNAVLKFRSSDSTSPNLSENTKIYLEEFKQALFNDLNSPLAISILWKVIDANNLTNLEKLTALYEFDRALCFGMKDWVEEKVSVPDNVQKLLEERLVARQNKDWTKSDELRDKIKDFGFLVKDTAGVQEISLIK